MSIVIVETSNNATKTNFSRAFLDALSNTGFRDNIHPIGINDGEISDLKIYSNIKEVPDMVD